MIKRLVILGALGDLATRHLLPALGCLLSHGCLPPMLCFIGVGREPLTRQAYQEIADLQLVKHAPDVSPADRNNLVGRLDYIQADLGQQPSLRTALGGEPVVAYLALPPTIYPAAVCALRAGGLTPGSRIVVEKPFGVDLASSRELSRLLHAAVGEQNVFRVDHFLYHQSVQDLLALRFATPIFQTLWHRDHLERVEITWEESTGVKGRAEFYDGTGALKDMIQSHLLQILALVAMEQPKKFDKYCLRDEKAAILRQVRILGANEVATRTARGRYTGGTIQDQSLRSYVEENGVDPFRNTETYAYLQLAVDTPRWRDVPFVLRTGKALGEPCRRITLHFRTTPELVLAGTSPLLFIQMAPDRIVIELPAAASSGLPATVPVQLEVSRFRQLMPASARILRDVLLGDPTFMVRGDEAEHCWRIVDAVLDTWQTGIPPLQSYAAGSAGPRLPSIQT